VSHSEDHGAARNRHPPAPRLAGSQRESRLKGNTVYHAPSKSRRARRPIRYEPQAGARRGVAISSRAMRDKGLITVLRERA